MNCVTVVPKELHIMERNDNNRRTSRGLASCLRGESEEYFEAAGKNAWNRMINLDKISVLSRPILIVFRSFFNLLTTHTVESVEFFS